MAGIDFQGHFIERQRGARWLEQNFQYRNSIAATGPEARRHIYHVFNVTTLDVIAGNDNFAAWLSPGLNSLLVYSFCLTEFVGAISEVVSGPCKG